MSNFISATTTRTETAAYLTAAFQVFAYNCFETPTKSIVIATCGTYATIDGESVEVNEAIDAVRAIEGDWMGSSSCDFAYESMPGYCGDEDSPARTSDSQTADAQQRFDALLDEVFHAA